MHSEGALDAPQICLIRKAFITLITIELSNIFVECVYVSLQSARLRKTFVAKLTTYLMANAVGSEMIP